METGYKNIVGSRIQCYYNRDVLITGVLITGVLITGVLITGMFLYPVFL